MFSCLWPCFSRTGGSVLIELPGGINLVTRNGEEILRSLIFPPLASNLVLSALTHTSIFGDGSKSFVLIVSRGLEAAAKESQALQFSSASGLSSELRFLSCQLDQFWTASVQRKSALMSSSDVILRDICSTCLCGSLEGSSSAVVSSIVFELLELRDHLSVVSQCRHFLDNSPFDIVVGGSLSSSEVIDGVVVKGKLLLSTSPKRYETPKVCVIGPILEEKATRRTFMKRESKSVNDSESTSNDVLFNDESHRAVDDIQQFLESAVAVLTLYSVNLVVLTTSLNGDGELSAMCLEFARQCAVSNIAVFGANEDTACRQLLSNLQIEGVPSFHALDSMGREHVGVIPSARTASLAGTLVLLCEGLPSKHLIVRASTRNMGQQYVRAIQRCMKSIIAAVDVDSNEVVVVGGGGMIEASLARHFSAILNTDYTLTPLRKAALRIAIAAFEAIPQLICDSRRDYLILSQGLAKDPRLGLWRHPNGLFPTVCADVLEKGLVEPYAARYALHMSAWETMCQMLRIEMPR